MGSPVLGETDDTFDPRLPSQRYPKSSPRPIVGHALISKRSRLGFDGTQIGRPVKYRHGGIFQAPLPSLVRTSFSTPSTRSSMHGTYNNDLELTDSGSITSLSTTAEESLHFTADDWIEIGDESRLSTAEPERDAIFHGRLSDWTARKHRLHLSTIENVSHKHKRQRRSSFPRVSSDSGNSDDDRQRRSPIQDRPDLGKERRTYETHDAGPNGNTRVTPGGGSSLGQFSLAHGYVETSETSSTIRRSRLERNLLNLDHIVHRNPARPKSSQETHVAEGDYDAGDTSAEDTNEKEGEDEWTIFIRHLQERASAIVRF